MNRGPSFRNILLMIVSVLLCNDRPSGGDRQAERRRARFNDGEPLVGANIVLLGTTLGAATDASGRTS